MRDSQSKNSAPENLTQTGDSGIEKVLENGEAAEHFSDERF